MSGLDNQIFTSSEDETWMSPEKLSGLVSVIIPAYNRASLLPLAIKSVIDQTYRPIEVIVVDDGSNDLTREVIQSLNQHIVDADPICIHYHYQNNLGPSAARNRGLRASCGEFIQFLDSDDLLHPEKLAIQVQALTSLDQVDYVYGEMVTFSADVVFGSIDLVSPQIRSSNSLYLSSRINTIVGMYRRSLCLRVGPWNEIFALGDDWDYHLRMLFATPRIGYLPLNLAAYRLHNCSTQLTQGFEGEARIQAKVAIYTHLEGVGLGAAPDKSKFVCSIAIAWTETALDALACGQIRLARSAVSRCWQLPVSVGRRFRLLVLQLLSYLPSQTFASLHLHSSNRRA